MAMVFDTGSGQICVDVRGRDIVHATYSGTIDNRMIAFQKHALDAALARTAPARVFVDAEGMTSHTSEARIAVTNFWKTNMPRVLTLHIVMNRRARLVTMAIQVINLALGGIGTIEKDRASFEAALARAERTSGTMRAVTVRSARSA